jgi:hypothetical protein
MGAHEMSCDNMEMRGNELLEWAREENEPELERYAIDALSMVDRYRQREDGARPPFGAFRCIEQALQGERKIGPWERRVFFER